MPRRTFHRMGVLCIRHSSRSFVLYLIFCSFSLILQIRRMKKSSCVCILLSAFMHMYCRQYEQYLAMCSQSLSWAWALVICAYKSSFFGHNKFCSFLPIHFATERNGTKKEQYYTHFVNILLQKNAVYLKNVYNLLGWSQYWPEIRPLHASVLQIVMYHRKKFSFLTDSKSLAIYDVVINFPRKRKIIRTFLLLCISLANESWSYHF